MMDERFFDCFAQCRAKFLQPMTMQAGHIGPAFYRLFLPLVEYDRMQVIQSVGTTHIYDPRRRFRVLGRKRRSDRPAQEPHIKAEYRFMWQSEGRPPPGLLPAKRLCKVKPRSCRVTRH